MNLRVDTRALVLVVILLGSLRIGADDETKAKMAKRREAQEFLAKLYAIKDAHEAESFVKKRIRLGDSLTEHGAFLSLAMDIHYNYLGDCFGFEYQQGGVTNVAQGVWVLCILTDKNWKIVGIDVGIAKH